MSAEGSSIPGRPSGGGASETRPVGVGGRAAGGSAGAEGDVRLYDPAQAAELLQVRESTLREWVRRRKVPHRRLGRAIRFSADDLRKIIAGSGVGPVTGTGSAGLVPASVVPVPLPKRRRSGR